MRLFLLTVAAAALVHAQPFNNGSLTGKYYFVHLQVTASGGQATDGRNLSGSITFNGTGGYTYTGKLGVGSGSPAASSGNGTYTVAGSGSVTMTSALRSSLQLRAALSGDRNVLLGASTEAADNTNDLFAAIKAPTANVTNSVLTGAYTGGSLLFPNGASTAIKSSVVALTANGSGQFTAMNVLGHAADQAGRTVSQDVANSTYTVNGDGSGTANFGAASSLFNGARDIFVSQDGNYLLAASTAAGARDIFVATKNFGTSAAASALDGRYWIAELTIEGTSFSAASGAMSALGNGRVIISERLHQDTRIIDFSGINSYAVNADSSGALSPLIVQGLRNMALGISVSVGGTLRPHTLVGAQVGPLNATTPQYGLFFAVRAPTITGTGVFLDPAGVVNNASFAPIPYPISPGAIVSLFGSGLSTATASATAVPLPTNLSGVSVTVNNTAAAFFSVSPGQVNIQVPFGLTGSTATVRLTNPNGSSEAIVPVLAATSPGIISYADATSSSRGIILHPDFTLVTPEKPARPGGTVIIYLSGLGALNPPVASGAANPGSPLARAVDPQIQVLFGSEVATNVPYIGGAPFFVGLNQINVVIPLTVIAGNNVPVAIATGNAFTDLVDIAISAN